MRRPVCIFAVVFAAVIWLVITLFPARDRPDPRTEGRYVTVTGRVEWTEHALKNTDFSDQGNDREYLRVSLGKVRIDAGIPQELTLPVHGDEKVLCEIREDLPEQENAAGIGAVVRIRGKLKNFRSPSNDGGFDAYTYYTLIRGYRFSLSDAHIMEYTDPGGPLRTRICRARNFFSSQLDRIYGGRDGTFGGTCASVMKAILLGQSSLADPEIKERFRDAGIVHIICISGLHISMIGTAVLRILRKAGLPLPVSSAAAFAVILVYSVMTGLQMSCVRALIMFAMQITAGMIGRTYDMLTSMSVAAVLLQKAIGDNLICVFVDHGLLRKGEGDFVEQTFRKKFGMRLIRANAETRFLAALRGVTDPEKKRKIIGAEFIHVFEEEAKKLGKIDVLAQGTIYPDVIESGKGAAATIKSHHNVGGLPEHMGFSQITEPLRELFKDEVREIGEALGLPRELVWRQPFPGPGLGVRVLGEITKEKLDTLREADAIFRETLEQAAPEGMPNQYFAVLTESRSVGVMGDERTYGYTVALRAVTTDDFMTATWTHLPYELLEQASSRITNEVKGISRVVYDITSKPPATVEWE